MLFAPAELNPYDWWFIKTFNAWQKRYWQADYDEWVSKMRQTPGLLENYEKYREQLNLINK